MIERNKEYGTGFGGGLAMVAMVLLPEADIGCGL